MTNATIDALKNFFMCNSLCIAGATLLEIVVATRWAPRRRPNGRACRSLLDLLGRSVHQMIIFCMMSA